MIERTINISGKDVQFRSSATVPRLYRAKFKRDIFKDLSKLEKSYKKRTDGGEELQIDDLEIFENVAYVMAYHADPSIPKPDDGCAGKKRTGRSEREMTTPLFLLRCCEVGISIRDLDLLTIGVVLDMWTEKSNDGVKYRRIADQIDFDRF